MRQWLYELLRDDVTLASFHMGRVYQTESMTSSTVLKPFMVYSLGNATSEDLGGELEAGPYRQFFTIYIHDVPADYTQIDKMVKALKTALVGQSSPADDIMLIRFLETSSDQDDETMGTILKYVRFQAIKER